MKNIKEPRQVVEARRILESKGYKLSNPNQNISLKEAKVLKESYKEPFNYKGINVQYDPEEDTWYDSNGHRYMSYLTPADIRQHIDMDDSEDAYSSKKDNEDFIYELAEELMEETADTLEDYEPDDMKCGKDRFSFILINWATGEDDEDDTFSFIMEPGESQKSASARAHEELKDFLSYYN